MTFSEVLTDATRNVEGVLAVALVGLDGIGVETVLAEGVEGINAEEVEVELAGLVGSINKTLSTLAGGKTKEFLLEADNSAYLLSLVDPNYFVAFVLEAGANLGRARFEARRTSQRLRDSF